MSRTMRANVLVPFPTLVTASAPATVTKVNGIWTIGISTDLVGRAVPIPGAYATDFILVWDSIAKVYFKVNINDLFTMIGTTVPTYDAAAGNYNVTNETVLLINKVVPAAHNINLPNAASRLGVPIIIKDVAGNASGNIATIVPNGAERIDGLATLPINSDYGGFKLTPITVPAAGWYISP